MFSLSYHEALLRRESIACLPVGENVVETRGHNMSHGRYSNKVAVNQNTDALGKSGKGSVLNPSFDLRTARPGDIVDVPF